MTSLCTRYIFVLISSLMCFVSLVIAFLTIACIALSSSCCLVACSTFYLALTVLASATLTSINPSFLSVFLSNLGDPFKLLECRWKETYLLRLHVDFFTCCLYTMALKHLTFATPLCVICLRFGKYIEITNLVPICSQMLAFVTFVLLV